MKYDQLQQTFIEKETECTSLQERFDELRETLSKYESSIEQTLQSNQRYITTHKIIDILFFNLFLYAHLVNVNMFKFKQMESKLLN